MSSVDNKLKLLISLYEEEKLRLQKFIEEYLEDAEYLLAHYHSEALFDVNSRLQTLQNIDDKLYDEKDYAQRKIDGLQKLKERESEGMKEFYDKYIQQAKEELDSLNKIPKQSTLPDNETLLDETLAKLVDRKIKNFKLILKKSNNLFLGFTYSQKMLKVTLPYVKKHTKKWILDEDTLNSFKSLGFDLTENESKLTLMLTGSKDDVLSRLKKILARIVFDIFYFKQFDNECFIQYTEKSEHKH